MGRSLIGVGGGRAVIVELLVPAARSAAYSCGVQYDEESRREGGAKMTEPDRARGFMDKLRGGMSTREGIREGAKMMMLFMEEFTAAGFTRQEVIQLITGMMVEGVKGRQKTADASPKENPDASGDVQR
jgi:hypothetical protein